MNLKNDLFKAPLFADKIIDNNIKITNNKIRNKKVIYNNYTNKTINVINKNNNNKFIKQYDISTNKDNNKRYYYKQFDIYEPKAIKKNNIIKVKNNLELENNSDKKEELNIIINTDNNLNDDIIFDIKNNNYKINDAIKLQNLQKEFNLITKYISNIKDNISINKDIINKNILKINQYDNYDLLKQQKNKEIIKNIIDIDKLITKLDYNYDSNIDHNSDIINSNLYNSSVINNIINDNNIINN